MVSIITPVYNSEKLLSECIDSVINQTFTDWELILVDDCSKDNSKEIIENYTAKDERIKSYFFNENVGAGVARNKGIDISSRRFIAFLDSDDYWREDKLDIQINFMIKNKVEFSFSRYYLLDSQDLPTKLVLSPTLVNHKSLVRNNYIKTLTAVYDSKNIGKIYMPNYRKRQDWGLWFNILDKTKTAHGIEESLAYYRTSNSSLSKNKFLLIKENFNFFRYFLKKNIFISFLMLVKFLAYYFCFKIKGYKKVNSLKKTN